MLPVVAQLRNPLEVGNARNVDIDEHLDYITSVHINNDQGSESDRLENRQSLANKIDGVHKFLVQQLEELLDAGDTPFGVLLEVLSPVGL